MKRQRNVRALRLDQRLDPFGNGLLGRYWYRMQIYLAQYHGSACVFISTNNHLTAQLFDQLLASFAHGDGKQTDLPSHRMMASWPKVYAI